MTGWLSPEYADEDEIDTSELEEMTREEAIEYLTELGEIPAFEYAQIEISIGNHYIHRLIDYKQPDENFTSIISKVIDGLLQTPKAFNEAVKAASIELQKKAEKQREIDNRIKKRSLHHTAKSNIFMPHLAIRCK